MNYIDFIIGILLMNAMPHFVMGITKTRFLGLFGFHPKGNIAYSLLQFVICLSLFHWKYGISALATNGIFLAALLVLVGYYIFGKIVVTICKKDFSLHISEKQK